MKIRLKRLHEQVIVITGASSGIGHTTARLAAERGARLVLAARSEQPLRDLADEIRASGGQARTVVADVTREEDVRRISAEAVSYFGGFDTWVNNAGVSIFGRTLEVAISDAKKLFETNFWGLVYGSLIACEHLRQRGGALINLGSVVSDRAIPLQGFYSASKHAVKGFTDSLRMELEQEGSPISVTLIKPTGIDTPYTKHALNLMDEEPKLPPPVYHPELVAEAILRAAEKPVRDLFVGGAAKMIATMESASPGLTDAYMKATMFSGQKTGRPAESNRDSGLHHGSGEGMERGDHPGMVRTHSVYQEAVMHPLLAGMLGLGATLAVGALLRGRSETEVR
jgi:short-subunit dehydrogenase